MHVLPIEILFVSCLYEYIAKSVFEFPLDLFREMVSPIANKTLSLMRSKILLPPFASCYSFKRIIANDVMQMLSINVNLTILNNTLKDRMLICH